MKQRITLLTFCALTIVFTCRLSLAQTSLYAQQESLSLISSAVIAPMPSSNSSRVEANTTASGSLITSTPRHQPATLHAFRNFGTSVHIGIGGIGTDIATPLAQRFNLRVGGEFFKYSTSFQEQGANIDVHMQLRSGHTALDWFPFGGRFRVSPLAVFGNNNGLRGNVLVPAGSTISLSGGNYISSQTDPLHGSASVDFRKVSPGLSIGFGNIVPRNGGHFSFPVEAGFYYVGQPRLQVAFTGSACDPNLPPTIGCQSVSQDAEFRHDLMAFTARNSNNLSYASFFPIFSVGFSYSFSKQPSTF